MTGDHYTYQRATRVSLIGLGIQVVLSLVMFVYAFQSSDTPAMTAAFAMMLGIPVWVALALVFHQHRLERLEALERDAYAASSAAQSTVFEEAGTDQTVQAEKLAWMHKWFLPAVSLLLGAAFIGLGVFRYTTRPEDVVRPDMPGWAIAIGVVIAVICFVFARFVAGMAKQKVWSLLHAGSASAVSAAILGLLVALAHFIAVVAGQERLFELLPAIAAGYMVALGAEILLNFVLNLYRPRKPGEYPRPAFDSRVLAFIAAPDRLAESISDAINYQLGFNVSSTWFYQLMTRAIGVLTLLAVVALWGLSCFTVISPNEQGLVMRNGKLIDTHGPGLVIKAPWPFATVETRPAAAVMQLDVGSPPADESKRAILWTTEHSVSEEFFIVRASELIAASEDENRMDISLLVAEIPIQFVVRDLRKYQDLAQDGPAGNEDQYRHDLLEYTAYSIVVESLGTLTVDEVLGPERGDAAAAISDRIQTEFDALDAGVEVLYVGLAGIHPQTEVAKEFIGVVAADYAAASRIEQARAIEIEELAVVAGDVARAQEIAAAVEELDDLTRVLDRMMESNDPRAAIQAQATRVEAQEAKLHGLLKSAGGFASELLSEARSDRWDAHFGTRALASRMRGQVASYEAAPEWFQSELYLQSLRAAAANARVWITAFERTKIEIDVRDEDLGVTSYRPTMDEATQE